MENINEPRKTLSDEDLEKAAGGTDGAGQKFDMEMFNNFYLARVKSSIPDRPGASEVSGPLGRDMVIALKTDDFSTVKSILINARDLSERYHFPATRFYITRALEYLGSTGKIEYP